MQRYRILQLAHLTRVPADNIETPRAAFVLLRGWVRLLLGLALLEGSGLRKRPAAVSIALYYYELIRNEPSSFLPMENCSRLAAQLNDENHAQFLMHQQQLLAGQQSQYTYLTERLPKRTEISR